MMRNILYIINPVAGIRNKKILQQLIEEKTKENGIPFLIVTSVANGDHSFLQKLISEKKITDVIIAGGDGTVSQVVSSLMNCDVIFGIIPCGSGNGLAYAAKIPKQATKALEIIFKGKVVEVDGFTVNDKFACMLCGFGFDAKVAEDFAQQPKRGFITYLKLTIKNFLLSKTYSFKLEWQDAKLKIDAYFISVANSNQFGNHLTIAPHASLSDGLVDVVILPRQNKLKFALNTFKQIFGWNRMQTANTIEKNKNIIYFQADKLKVINLSKAPFHIDGEPAGTPDELKIEVKKKCFRLIQP